MDILEAIASRRTIFHFKPDSVPRALLERILGYGIWAPNHHLTNPWRFIVLGEATRHKLSERYREIQMEKAPDHVPDEARNVLGQKGFQKFMSKPTVVAVSCLQDGDEDRDREDYAATCCAMQNVQLAAWSEGIGIQWSTGPITKERATYERLGVDPEKEYIIGFFYAGYPAEMGKPKRAPLEAVLRWTE